MISFLQDGSAPVVLGKGIMMATSSLPLKSKATHEMIEDIDVQE